MNKNDIIISVNIITYNHESYITQALEGVLMQKTNFFYEIVICDDFSTDSTRTILEHYQRTYPNIIRLRFRDRNLGLKYNYFDNIKACAGKYVAICEGDDYWTDPYKLQKQVDFMEAHPNFSMCFHEAIEAHQYTGQPYRENIFSVLEDREYVGEEILSNWIIATASVVFRNNISFDFNYINEFLFYDIVLFLRLCEHGNAYCMKQTMSVYRRHSNSITNSNLSYKNYIKHLKYLNLENRKKYNNIIKKAIAIEYLKRAKGEFKKKSLFTLSYLIRSLSYDITPFYSLLLSQVGK
ncbi:glycosyltransferase [Spirosoma harenae]